jgi:hypothetical protein
LKRVVQIGAADDHAVVFQHHTVRAGREGIGDVLAQLFAAGARVWGVGNFAADRVGDGLNARIGELATDAEGDERAWMRVDDGLDVGTTAVDFAVKGKLRGWRMQARFGPVGMNADDVTRLEAALVHA